MSNRGPPDIAGLLLPAVWAAGLALVLALDDPRLRFPAFLAGVGTATVAWLLTLARARRGALSPRAFALALLLGLAARAWALALPPAFSEDVFRYVYEGRVVWALGPAFPFVHAPASAPALGVPPELIDASWLRINHPDLPTIYPPFAQLVFVLAASLGTLFGGAYLFALKLLLVIAELAAILLLARALAALGRRQDEVLAVVLCPIPVLEVAREGHADSLSMFGLALAIAGFVHLRPREGYAGLALAALAKLNGLVGLLVAARSERRGLLFGLALSASCLLPVAFAGLASTQGLGAYASSWRAGDGSFTIVLALSGLLLGGDWRRFELGSLGSFTLTQDQLARGLTLVLFLAIAAMLLRRRIEARAIPSEIGLLLLFLLLLAPTLHPWYALWILPFVLVLARGRAAAIALLALVPLLHHPGWLELSTGTWTDVGWVRALVHVPVWGLVVRDLVRAPRLG